MKHSFLIPLFLLLLLTGCTRPDTARETNLRNLLSNLLNISDYSILDLPLPEEHSGTETEQDTLIDALSQRYGGYFTPECCESFYNFRYWTDLVYLAKEGGYTLALTGVTLSRTDERQTAYRFSAALTLRYPSGREQTASQTGYARFAADSDKIEYFRLDANPPQFYEALK